MFINSVTNAFHFALVKVRNSADESFTLHSRLTLETLVVLLLPTTKDNSKCKYVDNHLEKLTDIDEDVKVFWCEPKDSKSKYYPKNAEFVQEIEDVTTIRKIFNIKQNSEAAVIVQGKEHINIERRKKDVTFLKYLLNGMEEVTRIAPQPQKKKAKKHHTPNTSHTQPHFSDQVINLEPTKDEKERIASKYGTAC
jgi:hypothetical protein